MSDYLFEDPHPVTVPSEWLAWLREVRVAPEPQCDIEVDS